MISHKTLVRSLATFFGLGAALALAQPRPLDNIASWQYQHEIRPLRLALDRWLHELGHQEAGLSIRLVKASDLALNSCGMSNFDVHGLVGEIDVLRSDEHVNLPGCLDGVDVPKDQLNTVIHEVMHMVLDLHVSDEAKVVAISEVIQPRRRHRAAAAASLRFGFLRLVFFATVSQDTRPVWNTHTIQAHG